jgi:hypothetical protein
MAASAFESNKNAKPDGDSISSGLTKFPGSGGSELPPLPRARRMKAVIIGLIMGVAGMLLGAGMGLLWGFILQIFEGDGAIGGTSADTVWGRIATSSALWAIVGFIAGLSGRPLESILGAIVGGVMGLVLPSVIRRPELMTPGVPALAVLGAMVGAYLGELRSERDYYGKSRQN